jgi:hypothetical protein
MTLLHWIPNGIRKRKGACRLCYPSYGHGYRVIRLWVTISEARRYMFPGSPNSRDWLRCNHALGPLRPAVEKEHREMCSGTKVFGHSVKEAESVFEIGVEAQLQPVDALRTRTIASWTAGCSTSNSTYPILPVTYHPLSMLGHGIRR